MEFHSLADFAQGLYGISVVYRIPTEVLSGHVKKRYFCLHSRESGDDHPVYTFAKAAMLPHEIIMESGSHSVGLLIVSMTLPIARSFVVKVKILHGFLISFTSFNSQSLTITCQ